MDSKQARQERSDGSADSILTTLVATSMSSFAAGSAQVTARLIELAHPSHDISLTSNSISRARSEPEAQMRRLAFHRDGRLSYQVDWNRVAAATAVELTE